MKVIFVCNGNVGRSQVARVYFDRVSRHESSSAGTGVDEHITRRNIAGRRLKDVPGIMSLEFIQREFGVDISEKKRCQLTPEIVDDADMVIVINEKENWPNYLQEGAR